MEALGISQAKFFAFFLVLLRFGAMFAIAPVFGTPFVPQRVKAAVVVVLTVCLAAVGAGGEVAPPAGVAELALFVIQEIVLGLLLGFVARLVFAAVEFAGQLVGVQMGLGIVSVLDPQFETQVSIISQFQFLMAVLLFLAIGGDRMLIEVFAANLDRLPPGRFLATGPALKAIVALAGEVFRVGLQVAAPVLVALLASQVILGVIARSVPQMNMLILGFPIHILLGFGILGLGLPHWGRTLLAAFSSTFEALRGLAALVR